MKAVGDAFRRADVRAIYLVHGTFVGADALGLIREVARVSPKMAEPLRRLQKQLADSIAKDAGNYTVEFAEEFEQRISTENARRIPVKLFNWSSENHHIGRADGAVRLIDELSSRDDLRGGRVLLCGHSHGGNVFALLTNLLNADSAMRSSFFRAARSYFRWPVVGKVDMPVWTRVRSRLGREGNPLAEVALDLATFGTPVRYGWEMETCANLLHFINHRPVPGRPADRAAFPPEVDDVLNARYGDYIQQIGIAGTNFAPAAWAWRAWLADIRLGKTLQAGIRKRDLLTRLKEGIRAHVDGTTLLVDYGPAEGHIGQHVTGHAIYTRLDWLLFHAEEVARRFYQLGGS
jgi:hypothetical protein